MPNKDGYVFWCSSCKRDHAGECAKPGEASGKAMASCMAATAGLLTPKWFVTGPDTSGSCPEPDCVYCGTGKYSGT